MGFITHGAQSVKFCSLLVLYANALSHYIHLHYDLFIFPPRVVSLRFLPPPWKKKKKELKLESLITTEKLGKKGDFEKLKCGL